MERALFYLRIFPGTEEEYDRRHRAIWPELAEAIRSSGIRNMTGFRRGTDVWYYAECEPDVRTAFASYGSKPVTERWNDEFRAIIAEMNGPDGDLLWYREVFHADGPPLSGPMTRGLFSLVVDPQRVGEYDRRHAEPWPDLMDAIVTTGFRNYSGFRRGPHVVYYGEYYPDMATVFERIGKTEVNARWGASFEGIITTIVDSQGRLITAQEVFHQD
jgi:L-rhamnose mutarotase